MPSAFAFAACVFPVAMPRPSSLCCFSTVAQSCMEKWLKKKMGKSKAEPVGSAGDLWEGASLGVWMSPMNGVCMCSKHSGVIELKVTLVSVRQASASERGLVEANNPTLF